MHALLHAHTLVYVRVHGMQYRHIHVYMCVCMVCRVLPIDSIVRKFKHSFELSNKSYTEQITVAMDNVSSGSTSSREASRLSGS